MIPAAYQCEYGKTLPAGGAACTEPQHLGTGYCAAHLEVMRARWIAIHDREEALKAERFMAARREADALDYGYAKSCKWCGGDVIYVSERDHYECENDEDCIVTHEAELLEAHVKADEAKWLRTEQLRNPE